MPPSDNREAVTSWITWLGRLLLLLLLAYPFALHLGVINDRLQPALLLLLGVLLLSGLVLLANGNRYGWLPLMVLLAAGGWLIAYQDEP